MKQHPKIKVALADDHVLLRNGLAAVVGSFGDYAVLFQADNGKHFQQQIKEHGEPDIVLMDINMPEMDGYATSQWLKEHYPLVQVIALSMYDNENAIIKMFKAGAKGYILKDSEPPELKRALDSVREKGFYYSEMVTGRLIHTINKMDEANAPKNEVNGLNDREVEFLRHACTEMTYKEIAEKMFLSPRTIDGYRDALFEKLELKTRVGLVMYAIKNGIVNV
ncbi:response regulator transcription factor [Lacibacter luteus]|uniref:Response regulator transcription factor n=1 Tax=Lacibacter luteus TaxID=2508719 RepID=A0A4Q1CHK0_9BACT|nr:response regulator transcription factor [Lacibacter luteus]RXK59808.1 response regulator transcription factor [Lacibacter luteus]